MTIYFSFQHAEEPPQSGFYLYLSTLPVGFVIRGERGGRSDIEEFYILPCYRKQGYGSYLARQVFDLFPGPWQVRQIATAHEAIAFWRRVIHTYTGGNYTESMRQDPSWGEVICQQFTSSSK